MTKRNLEKRTKPRSQIYRQLVKRKHIAWIARLRTGHCSLNSYLERFKIIDHTICPACGDAKQTAQHFLLVCQKDERERDRMRKMVGVGGMKMEKLLGDSRRIQYTVEFIDSTRRYDLC